MKRRGKKKNRYQKVLNKNSLEMRNLARHRMPRPSIRMKSKKDYDRRNTDTEDGL